MKSLQQLFALLIPALIIVFSTNSVMLAEEIIKKNYQDEIPPIQLKYEPKPGKVNTGDRTQQIEFKVIDSMANAYSFFSDGNRPFVYEKESGTLMILKRGFHEVNTGYDGVNTKNNLFLRLSQDWGKTWVEPITIYDQSKNQTMGSARYPSVYGYMFEDELMISFVSPSVDEGGATPWKGFLCGFWAESFGSVYVLQRDARNAGNIYTFGTDSKLLGGVLNDVDPYGMFASVVSSQNDPADNNNIVFSKSTTNLDEWPAKFPSQWLSSNFMPVEDLGFRTNEAVGLHWGPNGSLIFIAHGRFQASENNARPVPGFSVSEDLGQTWSEFNIFPYSILYYYIVDLGINPENVILSWGTKGTAVMDNGDISIVLQLEEYDTAKDGEFLVRQIIEIYYENGSWGLRKVADKDLYLVYIDVTDDQGNRRNQLDIELQLTKTLDGKRLLAKWITLNGIDWVNSTFTNNDIVITTRGIGNHVWSTPYNITNDEFIDRITWLPDYIPSDLVDIPILKLQTMLDADDTDDSVRVKQFYAGIPQYVMMGHFTPPPTSIENDVINNKSVEFFGVYPNPTFKEASVNFMLDTDSHVKIEVFDVLGRKVMELFDGNLGAGLRAINFNADVLSHGSYYCTLMVNGNVNAKKFTVVK